MYGKDKKKLLSEDNIYCYYQYFYHLICILFIFLFYSCFITKRRKKKKRTISSSSGAVNIFGGARNTLLSLIHPVGSCSVLLNPICHEGFRLYMLFDCGAKKAAVQKRLGNGRVFGTGTVVALRISQAASPLHKKQKVTLKPREGKHNISFFF